MPAEHKNQLIIAVLGFAGVIVTTVSSNWDKWFPRSAPPPVVTTIPPAITTPPETATPSETTTPPETASPTPRVIPTLRVTPFPPYTPRHPHCTSSHQVASAFQPTRHPNTTRHYHAPSYDTPLNDHHCISDHHEYYLAAPWRQSRSEDHRGRSAGGTAPGAAGIPLCEVTGLWSTDLSPRPSGPRCHRTLDRRQYPRHAWLQSG
jgi:hypothetical protein